MKKRIKFDSLLKSHGIACSDNVDDYVFEYLFEALESNVLSTSEKVEWMLQTIPKLSSLRRFEVDKILSDLLLERNFEGSPCMGVKNPTFRQSSAAGISFQSVEANDDSSRSIVDEIKLIFVSRHLDGSDIIEEELIEYLITVVNEIEMDVESENGCARAELKDLLLSFLPEIDQDSDALVTISEILIKASRSRKVMSSKVSIPSTRISFSPSSSSSSKISGDSVSLNDKYECESAQTIDDISTLASMIPFVSEDLIRYVYSVLCASNRVEATHYLLERNDTEGLEKLQLSLKAYKKKEKESANLSAIQQQKMKATLCSKYGDLLVPKDIDAKGKKLKVKTLLPIQFLDIKEKDKKVSRHLVIEKII